MKATIYTNNLTGTVQDLANQTKVEINTNQTTGRIEAPVEPRVTQIGIRGPTGPGLTWTGLYDSNTTYTTNDIVKYNNLLYIYTSDVDTSGNDPTNTSYWDLLIDIQDSVETLHIIAGENIAPFRVVYVDSGRVYLADRTELTERDKIIGISQEAGVINNLVKISTNGIIENPSWSWNPGMLYIDIDGTLTQSLPTSGYLVQFGIALTTTKIIIDIDRVIEDHDHDPDYINVDEQIFGGTF